MTLLVLVSLMQHSPLVNLAGCVHLISSGLLFSRVVNRLFQVTSFLLSGAFDLLGNTLDFL